MELIQTKGKIKNGRLFLENESTILPNNGDVEVVIIVKNKNNNRQEEFQEAQREMQKSFQEVGIETQEQILDLIKDVKRELFEERFGK